MDPKIKNFDRGIEQMMNEHEVAPPFGMWNRISAELEAMPVPVAAAAPVVTSLIPKRALTTFIAGTLILGASILTGYMVNSSGKTESSVAAKPVTAPVATPANTVTAAINHNITQPVAVVKHAAMPVIPMVKEVSVNHISDNPVQIAQQVKPIAISNLADVPTPIKPVETQSNDNQTYYFPPIDVPTTEKSKPATQIAAKSHTEATTADDNDTKNSGGIGHFRRLHHKNHPWGYGIINRTK